MGIKLIAGWKKVLLEVKRKHLVEICRFWQAIIYFYLVICTDRFQTSLLSLPQILIIFIWEVVGSWASDHFHHLEINYFMKGAYTFWVRGVLPRVWGNDCLPQPLKDIPMYFLCLSDQEGKKSNDFQNKKGLYVNLITFQHSYMLVKPLHSKKRIMNNHLRFILIRLSPDWKHNIQLC